MSFNPKNLPGGEQGYSENLVRDMLQLIGDNPNREGLMETPSRVVKAWSEWFAGYKEDPADLFKVFEDGAEKADEMVLLTDIPVFSHCEHHITPIVGIAHVAYIPDTKIVGISKLARVVDLFSRRLQVQERLTNQIADAINDHLNPKGVAVIIRAKHFCMATRGVKMPNVDTTTSALRGVFKTDPSCRAEFMHLAHARNN
jgi:GTP cyclohydrolase IA